MFSSNSLHRGDPYHKPLSLRKVQTRNSHSKGVPAKASGPTEAARVFYLSSHKTHQILADRHMNVFFHFLLKLVAQHSQLLAVFTVCWSIQPARSRIFLLVGMENGSVTLFVAHPTPVCFPTTSFPFLADQKVPNVTTTLLRTVKLLQHQIYLLPVIVTLVLWSTLPTQ